MQKVCVSLGMEKTAYEIYENPMSFKAKASKKVSFAICRHFGLETNLLNDVSYSPQLCMAVWCGSSFLCFSFFLGVPLNLLIFTVVPSMETQ